MLFINDKKLYDIRHQAALSLRESYMLKAPNSKLSGKDKAAIVAKELGDFLGHYKRETELYTVFREESGMVPRHIFEEFIAFANDSGEKTEPLDLTGHT